MKNWISILLAFCALTGPAWAYRDTKLQEAVAKAEELLAKGTPEGAEKATKGILRAAESLKTGEAYVALGRVQERTGTSIDEAVASFAKAKELAAGDSEVLAAVALFELETAKAEQALETATAAVKASGAGAGAEAKATLSLALTASNDPRGGLKSAEEALAEAPTLSLAHEAKGQALFATGDTSGALALLEKAVALDPMSAGALVRLSVVLTASGRAKDGEAAAARALKLNKNSAMAMAAQAVAIVGVDPSRWSQAISDVQQGAFFNARSAFVHLSVGKVFEVHGDLENATQSYRKALETDPGFVAARFALVNVSTGRGDTKGAISEATELVRQVPENGEARLLLAEVRIAAKDYKGAEPELVKATELLPESADAHAYLAAINFANGKDQVALEEYKKALALKPENAVWRSDYALLLARLGRAEEGLEELSKVVDVPGYGDPAGFVNMGYLYRNMKPPKAEEAVDAYQKALHMNPGKEMAAQANLGLAWAYVALGQYDQAIEAYDQVNELEPKLAPEAFNGAGWCYLRKGDLGQAEAMVAKARAAGRVDSLLEDWVTKNKDKRANDDKTRAEILEEIERLEREAKWWEKLDEDLSDKRPAVRLRAVTKILEKPGKEAVTRLAYRISQDEDYAVREAATSALLAMPKHAATAILYVKAHLNLNCQRSIAGPVSNVDIAEEFACEDLKRTSREVLRKLGNP